MWVGSFSSFLAMNMQMITRGWLVLRVSGDSPLALALVTLSFAIPMTIVSPFAGVLADRISRKNIVIWSQLGNAILTFMLGLLDFSDMVTFWQIMTIGIFNGTLMACNMPSIQALISDIVPDNKLMNAISLNNSSMNLTRIVGPALAGFLILFMNTSGVLFLVAGIYLMSALTMFMINYKKPSGSSERSGVLNDIIDAVTHATRNPNLRGLLIMSLVPVLFGFSYYSLMPAWGREALNIQSDGLGILMMLMGVGATIGTITLATMGNTGHRGIFMLVSCGLWGIMLATFSQMSTFLLAMPFLILMGVASSFYMSLNMTMIQLQSDPQMRGRMMSISMMTFGLMPLSAVPFGVIAELIGTPNSLAISGVLLTTITVFFAIFNRTFRHMD